MADAVLFPGQGAQSVGMGRALAEGSPLAREVFSRADDALGFALSEIAFEGPGERLVETEIAQPALLTHAYAAWEVARASGRLGAVVAAAGHSLGEWTAHVAAGTIAFEDAVRLVNLRGRLMQEAVPLGVGAMAAVIGLSESEVRALCEAVSGVVEPATFNGDAHIVISGEKEAVEEAGARASELGALKVIPLDVSAPFHCSLMEPARAALEQALAAVEVRSPAFPVVSNVDASIATAPDAIRGALVAQLVAPVRWEDCLRAMLDAGSERLVVLGAGNSLARMVKRLRLGPDVRFLADRELVSSEPSPA
jgi:[acyl-carrier-protein] S-malonyltransferase